MAPGADRLGVEPGALAQRLSQRRCCRMVFTGTGAGQLSAGECRVLETWAGPRPLMLRANRCGSGPAHPCNHDSRLGLLPAGRLNPQKARVLLLLALIAGVDRTGLANLCTVMY